MVFPLLSLLLYPFPSNLSPLSKSRVPHEREAAAERSQTNEAATGVAVGHDDVKISDPAQPFQSWLLCWLSNIGHTNLSPPPAERVENETTLRRQTLRELILAHGRYCAKCYCLVFKTTVEPEETHSVALASR